MRNRTRLALGTLSISLLSSGPAFAYLCTRAPSTITSEDGPSLSWSTRELTFQIHQPGTDDIAGDDEFADIRSAFTVWENIEVAWTGTPCIGPAPSTDIHFLENTEVPQNTRIGYDWLNPESNTNLVIFQNKAWPQAASPWHTIALTTTTYNSLTGEILDGDIELNDNEYAFTNSASTAVEYDIINTLVHEIGHLLGLEHSSITNATMYASAPPGETKKRTLHCDEAKAIAFKYPANEPNGYCSPPVASCGMCAPPGEITTTVTIEVQSQSDGQSGCNNMPSTWLTALLIIASVVRQRIIAIRTKGQ